MSAEFEDNSDYDDNEMEEPSYKEEEDDEEPEEFKVRGGSRSRFSAHMRVTL